MKSDAKAIFVLFLIILAVLLSEIFVITSIDSKLNEVNSIIQSQQDVIESQKQIIDEFDWEGYQKYLIKKEIKNAN